jgi:hypothetical protein
LYFNTVGVRPEKSVGIGVGGTAVGRGGEVALGGMLVSGTETTPEPEVATITVA